MIAENMQHTIDSMRKALRRGNGDYAELAPFFLDSLEADVERVAGLQDAAVLDDAWRSLRIHFEDASGLKDRGQDKTA